MPFIGEISALATATLWAATSLLIAAVSSKIGSVQCNIGRMLLSIVFFLFSIVVFRLPIDLTSKQVTYLLLSAVVGIVFGDTFLFKAFQQVGARISMLIMSLAPAIAAVLAYFFLDETLSLWGIVGIVVTICGITLVVLERSVPVPGRDRITTFGIICAFLGAFGQGGGLIFTKLVFLEGPIHGIVASCIRIIAALIFLLPVAVFIQRVPNPIPLLLKDKKLTCYLMLIAFFGTFGGIT
ncbi:MAG: DMT family transporter, partial [bacterium]|nr:DMT family transporter [bacterium]